MTISSPDTLPLPDRAAPAAKPVASPYRYQQILAALLLVWVLGAGLALAWTQSPTEDEGIHILSGYTIVTKHEVRFDQQHPPLSKAITALPLLALPIRKAPDDAAFWSACRPTFYQPGFNELAWYEQWLYHSGNDVRAVMFAARIPAVLTLLGLCALVYWLAGEWFGPRAALWALFFAAFNPTFLAHGSLANDDVAVAAGIVGTIALLWRYLKRPTLVNALWIGAATSAAVCVKFSAATLLPLIFVAFVIGARVDRRRWRSVAGEFGVVLVSVWAGIWLWYGVQSPWVITPATLAQDRFWWMGGHHFTAAKIIHLAWIGHFVLPIQFLLGLMLVRAETNGGQGAWLLGHWYARGVWYYLPALYALKTQLVGLLLLAAGGVAAVRFRRGWARRPEYWLLAFSVVWLLAISTTSKLDLGVRYLTPAMALLSICLALAVERLGRARAASALPAVIALAYAAPVLIQWPNMIGFASEIVQPYSRAWWYMFDSNVDWGQQAEASAQLVRTRFGNQTVATNFPWSDSELQHYGMRTVPLDPRKPPAHTLMMVSATDMGHPEYEAFRMMTPVARIADSTLFFEIDATPAEALDASARTLKPRHLAPAPAR